MGNKYITPDIKKVEVLKDYKLKITFVNGEKKLFDMKNLIEKNERYKNLRDNEYFNRFKIRYDTIEWGKGEDVCPESLYYKSKKI